MNLKVQTIIQRRDVLETSASYDIVACLGQTVLRNSGNMVINTFSEIIIRTVSNDGKLNRRKPLEFVPGETVDISKCLDFDFYDIIYLNKMPASETLNSEGGLALHMAMYP